MNASGHGSFDEGTDVFVLNCSFVLVESAFFIAVDAGNVLEVTFSTLVADGAIERMISQKELHYTTSGDSCGLRFGNNLNIRSYLGST